MNKKIIGLSFIAALMGMSSIAQAASTGTITFTGELTDSTCDVNVDGASGDASVTLPTVSTSTLGEADATTGLTSFNLQLSGCTVETEGGAKSVSAFFQAGTTVDNATGRLNNTLVDDTGAKNVQLELLDTSNSNKVINVGSASQVSDLSYVTIAEDGSATLPYAVQYHATGKTEAGKVASSVVYNLQYK
jgi:major type 1 subunit fimbrin (pilin)